MVQTVLPSPVLRSGCDDSHYGAVTGAVSLRCGAVCSTLDDLYVRGHQRLHATAPRQRGVFSRKGTVPMRAVGTLQQPSWPAGNELWHR
eukprot:6213069-Pleurochrysis_carterae.AAC.1